MKQYKQYKFTTTTLHKISYIIITFVDRAHDYIIISDYFMMKMLQSFAWSTVVKQQLSTRTHPPKFNLRN